MNWKEIKEKYPKAHGKCYEYFFRRPLSESKCKADVMQLIFRDLYDFFDEQGIYVDIDCESISLIGCWDFTIDQKGKGHEGEQELFDTRREAETAAFTKAFEILEERLNA